MIERVMTPVEENASNKIKKICLPLNCTNVVNKGTTYSCRVIGSPNDVVNFLGVGGKCPCATIIDEGMEEVFGILTRGGFTPHVSSEEE